MRRPDGAARRGLSAALAALTLLATAAAAPTAAADPRASSQLPGPHQDYTVVRSDTPGLTEHTLLRPRELSRLRFQMPIVVWGNGGCRNSNMEFNYFLTRFASYGYFVIANGPPGNAFDPLEVTGMVRPDPSKLTAAISWAVRQNSDVASPFYRRLDVQRISVMGQSCGGYEALDASAADPRVASTIIWNSGVNPQNPGAVTGLHAPVLYVDGGSTDVMKPSATVTYEATEGPAVLASLADAGHSGMWADPTPPDEAPGPFQDEPLVVAQQWLMLTLYPDVTERSYFLGTECGLCQRPGWTVQAKNWGV